MDLDAFFREEGIEEYAIVGLKTCRMPTPVGPLHLIPCARSVIVFGMEIRFLSMRAPPERPKNASDRQKHWIVPLSACRLPESQKISALLLSLCSCPSVWSLGGARVQS